MDEVDLHPVDLGRELRQRVQSRLALAPVVLGRPVAGELLQRRQLHALRPILDELLGGPARRREAPREVGERRHRATLTRNGRIRGVASFPAAAAVADAAPTAVAASTTSPTRRADVDESARHVIAPKTMIPVRKLTRRVSRSSGFMLFSSNA